MAFITPYFTDKFTAYPGDTIITNLSFAVWLTDAYTKNEPFGHIKVRVREGDMEAAKNLSGYYCFTDLATGNYTVSIESDLYFPEDTAVDTAALDSRNPVVAIELKPKSSYPFPGHATLVRGLVSNAEPVVGADVEVTGKSIKSITDERGEFVLYFKGIKTEAIIIKIKKGVDIKTVTATIEEGKTISLGTIHFP
ncbi:MAG TPA: hypothetical protein ENI58_06165 [Nitrospirae bacterium]|nr:hypothetical protein [Nitrospirota bacterium]